MPHIDPKAQAAAAQCRHYAMCKIDYLGTGICASGPERGFVTYYPQGRMDLYRGLAEGRIPVTEGLADAADTCTMCGLCDLNCHFAVGLRPVPVMKALKDYVEAFRREGGDVLKVPEDEPLRRLRSIVGPAFASNDPAVLWTYADDPFPFTGPRPPRYVVMPGSRDEVAAVVRLAGELGLPFVARGNGASVFGLVFTDGIVLDLGRMRRLDLDLGNFCAAVEPGVTSFELQQEAAKHGLRINAAEPAATVCGNIICTGTFSTWTNIYGTFADNFIDLEFAGPDGTAYRMHDRDRPSFFGVEAAAAGGPGLCTKGFVKLHPVVSGEEGLYVPFEGFEDAVRFAHELGERRIGSAVAVLGAHFISSFLSPDESLARRFKAALPEVLGLKQVVMVIADAYGRDAVRRLAPAVLDGSLLRTLMLGLPRLLEPRWLDLIRGWEGPERPYEILSRPDLRPVVEAAIRPGPDTIAAAVPEDLRPAYRRLYARPEMTDLVWLNANRIISARMSRHKHMLAFLVYFPGARTDVAREITDGFAGIAEKNALEHDFGFLTPLDLGKRAVLEYDYYLDHTDAAERAKIAGAMPALESWLKDLGRRVPGFTSLKDVFGQGYGRKESFLYRI